MARTHDVENQAPPLEGRNLFDDNVALVEALTREGGGWALDRCRAVGAAWGGAPVRWGFEANEHPPRLRTHDRYGHRIDEVEFHRAWHDLMGLAVSHELHSLPWTSSSPAAHVARTAMYLTAVQPEGGFACPITMTFAAVPALRAQPELAAEWEPRLTATSYDPELTTPGKRSALCGMAMTEKQGGSDVRANTTVAVPAGGGGSEYALTGHKWFCSAPMCDLFLVLAQAEGGLSCFALPRILPDGTRNAIHLQRLKDKLGNRSNASSEIELHGALAQMVGEPGRGVQTIIEMVGHTRLDCVIGTAAGMRHGVANATWHAAHRSAFGRVLAEQPLMRNVLADLCVESEAATALAMRLARAYDEAAAGDDTERAAAFKRLATAVAKYHVCKRGPGHAFEALECLGGNGYVEESGMPRLYREMPLASIWEGSGNVMALDILRALARTPAVLDVLFDELAEAAGADARLDAFCARLRGELADGEAIEWRARRLVEAMAVALQGSLLVRHAPAPVADAFCAARLGAGGGSHYGTLPAGIDATAIIDRHTPRAR